MVTGTVNGQCIGNLASIERIGFGGLCLSDGPQGLHLADLASVFPSGLTAAATWDRDLIARRGAAMGAEFRGKGANVMLGWGIIFNVRCIVQAKIFFQPFDWSTWP